MSLELLRTSLYRPREFIRARRWEAFKSDQEGEALIANLGRSTLRLDPDDQGISAELAIEGVHEPFATRLLLEQVKSGMTVVDVGSNIGYYAIQESIQVGPQGRVYCIEPNPSTHEMLLKNISLNQCSNAIPHSCAVSDSRGHVDFYASEKSNVSRIMPRDKYSKKMTVPTAKLDDLLVDESRVDLIRMDIEGHEVQALSGMLQTLRTMRPIVAIEFHFSVVSTKDAEWFFETFRLLGYKLDCFVFRNSDEIFFGRPLVQAKKIYREANLNDGFVRRMGAANAVVFLVPDGKGLLGNLQVMAAETCHDLGGF